MDIKPGFIYHIDDSYFDVANDPNLMCNKENGKMRPTYCCFKSDKDSPLIWMIPMSSRIDKYQKVIDKSVKKYNECLGIVIGKFNDGVSAFLLQNMFPVTPKYINHIHTISDNPISVSKNLMEELEQKANKIIALTQKGRKVTFTDIAQLKKQMLDEIEKSIIEDLPDKKEESRTTPEDMAKYKHTNEKCNEILNANPELKGKLNLATVEYCRKHNLNLPDSSLSADKRYDLRNAILNENPNLRAEYIKAKKAFERGQSQSQHQAKPNPKPPKQHR